MNLSTTEIQNRVDAWHAMGVAGIFLDEAGYDYGVTRQRQNDAVDYVHNKGLSVFINAWNPDDVFSPAVDSTYNPTGAPTHLGNNDIYLHESFQIILSGFQNPADWVVKSDKALNYKNQYSTRMATVTTVSESNPIFYQDKFDYAWWSTLLYGFDFMGWGELYFSASDNNLSYRTRPDPGEIGSAFTSPVTHAGDAHTRTTTTGTIEVNTYTHTGKFTLHYVPLLEVPLDIKPTSCPNPLNVKAKGVLPAAILGTADFDVTKVDTASIKLEGVATIRWALEDVATPFEPFTGKKNANDCTTEGPDGFLDLTLKFDTQQVVQAIGEVEDGEVVILTLAGNLKGEFGGTPIQGEDVIVILKKGKLAPALLTFSLGQNFRNPFNPDTWIPYTLAKDVDVVIRIHSLSGQLVRILELGHQPAGRYVTKDKAAYWDGKDSLGQPVASGVYYYTLQAGEFRATRKMVIVK